MKRTLKKNSEQPLEQYETDEDPYLPEDIIIYEISKYIEPEYKWNVYQSSKLWNLKFKKYNDKYDVAKSFIFNDIFSVIMNLRENPQLNMSRCSRYSYHYNDNRLRNLLINKGQYDIYDGFLSACSGMFSIDLVKKMCEHLTEFDSDNFINIGFVGACETNNEDVIEYLIEEGCDPNDGFNNFDYNGSAIKLFEILKSNGANDWDLALYSVCSNCHNEDDNIDVKEYCISNGASYCDFCQRSMSDHLEFVKKK